MKKRNYWPGIMTPRVRGGRTGGGAGGGGGGSLPAQIGAFTLFNENAASIEPRARFGYAVEKDVWPTNARVEIRTGGTPVAFSAVAAKHGWANGSLHTTADGGIVMHDTTSLASGASRDYEIWLVSGSQPAGTFDPWTWIANHARDFTVSITNRREGRRWNLTCSGGAGTPTVGETVMVRIVGGIDIPDIGTITSWDGTTMGIDMLPNTQWPCSLDPLTVNHNSGSGWSRTITARTFPLSMGDLTYGLKAAAAVTTRRRVLANTQRYCRVKVWQKVAGEEHLIVEWHIDFWLDASGNPSMIEIAPVLSMHWIVANPFGTSQTRQLYAYNAALNYGGTQLSAHSNVEHGYATQWAMLRTASGWHQCRKHCINPLTETVIEPGLCRIRYSDASLRRMMRAGAMPPAVRNYTGWTGYGNTPASIYEPFTNLGFRRGGGSLTQGGHYTARGIWGVYELQLISRQGLTDASAARGAWRDCRISSQEALFLPLKARDHRAAMNGSTGSEPTNEIIPLGIREQRLPFAQQNYPQLGAPAIYHWRNAPADFDTLTSVGKVADTYGANFYGSGSNVAFKVSHGPGYAFGMSFLEGERYLAEAARDIVFMDNTGGDAYWSFYGSDHNVGMWTNTRQSALGLPANISTNRWGTLMNNMDAEERSAAWPVRNVACSWILVSDDDPQYPWWRNHLRHLDAHCSATFGYYTSGHRNYGGVSFHTGAQYTIPWNIYFQIWAYYMADVNGSDHCPVNPRGMTGLREGFVLAGRWVVNAMNLRPNSIGIFTSVINTDTEAGAWLNFFPPADIFATSTVSIDTTTDVLTVSSINAGNASFPIQNGDRILFAPGSGSAPAPLNVKQPYYLINVSGNTCQISETPSGSPINLTSSTGNVAFIYSQHFTQSTPRATNPPADEYERIAQTVWHCAVAGNHPDLTSGLISSGNAFFAGQTPPASQAFYFDSNIAA
ncbi:MAG: hypothetical protein N2688_00200 [Burkholderiaceae bacterium]|nr:hypothetical protein [Burkholderiaceae bacterium]